MILKQPFQATQAKPWFWGVTCLLLLATSPAMAMKIPVSVYTLQGEKKLVLEIAATEEKRRIGLMERIDLEPCDGMIFLFSAPNNAAFWMKNTPVELDMIFINANYEIVHVEQAARPNTLHSRSAGQPVTAMIELAGRCAETYGIQVGDRVRYVLPEGVVVE